MASRKRGVVGETRHDEIGFWSEIKLDILKKYWPAYTTIVKKQAFHTVYVDAFAGSGQHISRTTGEFVAGSPTRALAVTPPFDEYHFIDLDDQKILALEELAGKRPDVQVHHGDCNEILRRDIYPHAQYRQYRRALCLLDPYSLQLDWRVMAEAGHMKSVEIFLNFPIMDINRNVLRSGASPTKLQQMDRFWGDDSWKTEAFRSRLTLFGDVDTTKVENWELVRAFQERLRKHGGFEFVPEPLAMRNSRHATVYYLFFAGNNQTGSKIVNSIFKDYRDKGYG